MAAIAYKWQQLRTHGNTCLQMAATVAYKWQRYSANDNIDYKRQNLRTHIATGAYTWQEVLTNGNTCLQMAAVADRWPSKGLLLPSRACALL
jgi:hypothetical protein